MNFIPLIVIAVVFVALAWFTPRLFAGVALLAVLSSATLDALLPRLSLGLIDEIAVTVAVVVLTGHRLVRRKLPVFPAWGLWFAGFFAFGLMSSLFAMVPSSIALQGAFLAVKAVLLGLAFAQIDWKPADLRPFITGGAVVTVVIFVACLVNAINPAAWTHALLGKSAELEGAFGIPALIGPFDHPASLGRICALLAIAILAYRLTVRSTWVSAVLLAMASVAALASLRSKTIVSLVVSVVVVILLGVKRMPRRALIIGAIVTVAISIPLGIYVWSDIHRYLVGESARSLMTLGSFTVADQHFPLGVGFGRFGSFVAAAHYSPEYLALHFNTVYGFSPIPGAGRFLTDTQWPAIIGESGWLGAALFAAGLVHMGIVFLLRPPADADPLQAWVRLTGVGWLVILVIESIAAPVFTSPPAYPLPFVAAGVYFALLSRVQKDQPRIDAQ